MNKPKPLLESQVFEARYERGYRYLDRCGDVMLVLEDLLRAETDCIWMPEDLHPSGAKIKCPDLDITVQFDSYHVVVLETLAGAQEAARGRPTEIDKLSEVILATLTGRFDLREFGRLGFRRFWWAVADSIDDAKKLSTKLIPLRDWPTPPPAGMASTSYEITSTVEIPDQSFGYRVAVAPAHRIDAPIKLDERLKMPPHALPDGQRDALINQIKRRKELEGKPQAGLQIDLDFYSARPAKPDVSTLFARARENGPKIIEAIVGGPPR